MGALRIGDRVRVAAWGLKNIGGLILQPDFN